MTWTDGARFEREAATEGRTGAVVNGEFIEIQPGANMVETCLSLAADAGYGKFRVFLNGDEYEPEDIPELLEQGDILKVTAYDVAGA